MWNHSGVELDRTTEETKDLDMDAAALLAFKVWTYKQGELVSLMIHLGDRLGLYHDLAHAGPTTPAELAERTGLHQRWLLEWLRGQAAAGLLETTDGETFEMSPESATVLSDESDSLLFAAGAFQGGAAPPEVVDRIAEAFRTGIGLTYDEMGPAAAHSVERMLAPWSRIALVPELLPRLADASERLGGGARVIDVGCGAGTAVLTLAEAFPGSTFEGWDPSAHAIERARAAAAERGIPNATFVQQPAAGLPDEPTFDLVLTFDCLHDMTHPEQAAEAIRGCIAADGTWLIKEVKAGDTWAENQRNPVLAMMYATSVLTCMSSALSAPDGAGLGTLGLPPARLEQLCRDAGFSGAFAVHDIGDPANLYYEVRPN